MLVDGDLTTIGIITDIISVFDLLNPNFDKFIHFPNFYQNLGLKGQQFRQKMDFWSK